MKQTLNITFFCRKSKVNKLGLAPIEMSIIINGKRTCITLPRKERPEAFKKQIASKRSNELKSFLESQILAIQSKYQELIKRGIQPAVDNLDNQELTIKEVFDEYFEILSKRVDIDLSLGVFKKYCIVRDLLYSRIDKLSLIRELNYNNVQKFIIHLKSLYRPSTVAGMTTKLKTISLFAFNYGHIDKNPFCSIKISKKLEEVQHLTQEEIDRIANKRFNERVNRVKDLFIFQCYTGMSFSDMANLKPEDYQLNEFGQYYVRKERLKTGIVFTTVLLKEAVEIAKKYDFRLPIISNKKVNSYLKEIADCCNINKRLHTHIARHTFATLLLNKGVSLETVSKMLGHSSIKHTTHYAKLLDKSVFKTIKEVVD